VRRFAFIMLATVIAVVAGIFIALAAGIRTATRLSNEQRQHVEALQTSTAVERLAIDLETGLRGYLLTHQRGFLAPYNAAVVALPKQLALLTTQIARTDGRAAPGQYHRVVALVAAIHAYEHDYAGPLADADGTLSPAQTVHHGAGQDARRRAARAL
jgi:hypothetical protein